MINFDNRQGPDRNVDYPHPAVPAWWSASRLGIFLHWGIYSVPAFAGAMKSQHTSELEEYRDHPYAEWYANTVRIPDSPTRYFHERNYGTGTSYEDLADRWRAASFDATAVIADCVRWGAGYVIPTAKHHDGFCLWPTSTTPFSVANRGPRRDLVGELDQAARDAGIRFGIYFSGALDWHVSDFPAIVSNDDLFRLRRNDGAFARYVATQLSELIERYRPDVLWNDIDWPDAGKGTEPWGLSALLSHYLSVVPDGIFNDRWGAPTLGFRTREYSSDHASIGPWETTRGIGASFGFNQAELASDLLDGPGLVRLLVRTAAEGGNLLLNIGLTADGQVPDRYRGPLDELGRWLDVNGVAIRGTTAWQPGRIESEPDLVYTASEGSIFAHVLSPSLAVFRLDPALADRPVWTMTGQPIACDAAGNYHLPNNCQREPVVSLRVGVRA